MASPEKRMFRLSMITLALAATLGLTACGKLESDKAFGNRVHAYLMAHPEVIEEASEALQAKQASDDEAKEQARFKAAIVQNRQTLEHDPADYVANPNGKITVTEFYDYRCPHCITMAPTVLSIIHENPNVRFVFKEFPIFGDASDLAAEGALLVKQRGGDYLDLYRDFMATKGLNDAVIGQMLQARGVSAANLADPNVVAQTSAHLLAVKQLAITLGIEGTPAFVIGDTLIPGEGIDRLRAAIKQAGAKQS
jgi:protein-disulfide isomerase